MPQEWYDTEKYAGPYITSESLINNGGRDVESLDGEWGYFTDQYGRFFFESWWTLDQHKRFQEDGDNTYDYSLNDLETIPVPSTINTEVPECKYFEGIMAYTRKFDYQPRTKGERVFLYFHGAQYRTAVTMNTKWLGKHRGGSTPFCVEITDTLAETNRLMIAVDCRRRADQAPTEVTDWFFYGGLYRSVELIRVPASFMRDWFVRLQPGSDFGRIAVDVEVDNPAADQPVTVAIDELGISAELAVDADGKASGVIEAKPELWSPDNPKLYDVRISYGQDEICEPIGFREIRVEGNDIILNGKPIWLRGICTHEDSVANGKSLTTAEVEENLKLGAELNCNFMRLAHYPHRQCAAQMADRMGMLLWEEIPVYWDIAFGNPETYADAENQMIELIRRDRNRASVIIWAVGNENEDSDDRLSFLSRLVDASRAADDSRLVTAACLMTKDMQLQDRLAEKLDVVGFNQYRGWYSPRGTIEEVLNMERDEVPTKPIIMSETGAAALGGKHGSDDERWTEEYQEWIYQKQVEYIQLLKSVRGMTPWILHDFRAPFRQNLYQKGFNRKGLLSADKTHRKKAFYVLQEFYAKLKDAAE